MRRGHVRVEEPLVLALGKVIEVGLDGQLLIAWKRKLLIFRVNMPGVSHTNLNMSLRSC